MLQYDELEYVLLHESLVRALRRPAAVRRGTAAGQQDHRGLEVVGRTQADEL